MPARRKTSRTRWASEISGPKPKNPREPSSPESEIPATQASEPAMMTAAVTIAERPGAAMLPPFARLDYAIGAQPGDLAIAHAQHLAQDLLGVPAQHRRRGPGAP